MILEVFVRLTNLNFDCYNNISEVIYASFELGNSVTTSDLHGVGDTHYGKIQVSPLNYVLSKVKQKRNKIEFSDKLNS